MDRERDELERAGLFDEDSDYNGVLGEAVMELLGTFNEQGHSGYSASIVSTLFKRLVDGKTLSPLTGGYDEWVEVSEGLEQNKRCSSVFRENGSAYNIDGRVFEHADGFVGQCAESHTPVTFPYTPQDPEIIVEGSEKAKAFLRVFA